MKHKVLDLKSEIERATLPSGLNGFLFPLFEAISNSLHAIEDRFGEDAHSKGQIHIAFDPDNCSIKVSDNGEGFTRRNVEAFLTPFTGNKILRNGKGFGRFISFKVFQTVHYAAKIQTEGETFASQLFAYLPLDPSDNLVPVKESEYVHPHQFDRGISVHFNNPVDDFSKYFEFRNDQMPDYSEEDILTAVLDHFLIDFIQKRTPNDFRFQISDAIFCLSEYYQSSVEHTHSATFDVEIDGAAHEFDLRFMKICASKVKKHCMYFYSDNRATSDLENISKGLKDGPFEADSGDKYFYLVAASSNYFTSSQSRDKITNLSSKVQHEGRSKHLKEHLSTLAKSAILDLEPAYTGGKRSTIRKHVEELIALDPMLRRGLGNQTIDEFVNARGILETREQIASDLFVVRMRSKFDFRRINSSTPFEELKRVVQEKIPDDAKEALAVYVAYRNDVIKILKEMLNRQSDGLAREDAVHELVYPRYKDSNEIDYSSHNLWLIDDDLAFAEYISSDRTISGKGRSLGSRLIDGQSQNMTVAARATAERKVFAHLS